MPVAIVSSFDANFSCGACDCGQPQGFVYAKTVSSLKLFAIAVGLATPTAAAGAYTRPLSAQPEPFWAHFPVSPCPIDWGKTMRPTYPTQCAYVEPRSGRV